MMHNWAEILCGGGVAATVGLMIFAQLESPDLPGRRRAAAITLAALGGILAALLVTLAMHEVGILR